MSKSSAIASNDGVRASDPAPKRRPGRPSSGDNLVQVCVLLRAEQVEWLKEFTAKRRPADNLNSVSAVLRGLIDSVFGKG